MKKDNSIRMQASINAGSMADIAFLLLIFFLVVTTINVDKGIVVKLPPISDDIGPSVPERNLLRVQINSENQLMVEGEILELSLLRERTKGFIMNYEQSASLPSSPKKAVVGLINDRESSYETYIGVYNELKAAYNELWDEEAQAQYNKPYESLAIEYKKKVRNKIPLVISESEPSNFSN